MKKLFLIFFITLSLQVRSQYDYSERCLEAHQLITSLRFDGARLLIAEEKQTNPENLIPLLLDNYIDFLTVIVGEDEDVFDSLNKLHYDRLKLLRDGNRNSPWYRSSIARVNLQWAFARVKFGEYFTAAREIRKAYVTLMENEEEYPGFFPDKVGLGLMHALIGTIPDNFRWIASIFSMEGSVEQGRNELLEVLESAKRNGFPYLYYESLFFITFIDLNLQADRSRSIQLLLLYDSIPADNLLLIYSKSRIMMQTGLNDDAIDLLVDYPKGDDYFSFFYLDYLAGLAKLNRLDDDAEKYLLRFTVNFKGSNYVKSAYQKLGWFWLVNDDKQKYKEYMQKVTLYGDDFTDGDKLAQSEAKNEEPPNICLLKARLLFDGGYYMLADSILERSDCFLESEKDRIEFPYRKGRIMHALGQNEQALNWYEKAINTGSKENFYFAANAALQAATIYESAGDLEKAEEYYKKCLRMKNKEYKTSISQKAKAGLNRINEKQKK
jgi:tetratricopeptide (TPR) repeat protein